MGSADRLHRLDGFRHRDRSDTPLLHLLSQRIHSVSFSERNGERKEQCYVDCKSFLLVEDQFSSEKVGTLRHPRCYPQPTHSTRLLLITRQFLSGGKVKQRKK